MELASAFENAADDEAPGTPPDVRLQAISATSELVPTRSKLQYEKT